MTSSSLSSYETACYTELCNDYLDKIPVIGEKKFPLLKEALMIIKNHGKLLDKHIKCFGDTLEEVQDLLKSPELFVKKEKLKAYKKIVLSSLDRKIAEIASMNKVQKRAYCQEQKKLKEVKRQKCATPIQKEVQTFSEEESYNIEHWMENNDVLREQLARDFSIMHADLYGVPYETLCIIPLYLNDIRELISIEPNAFKMLLETPASKIASLFDNHLTVLFFLKKRLSLSTLLRFSAEKLPVLFANPHNFLFLRNKKFFPLETLLNCPLKEFKKLLRDPEAAL
jgi:hypothetical protein